MRRDVLQPVSAGVIASIVGFASTFALVLSGLRAVGATEAQAASGLTALCLGMAVVGIWLALRYRLPIAIAWSTPGAALLISSGPPSGGYAAALGAFAVTGGLIVLAGLWRTLERWVAAIPVALASAMLAGVLLPVCLAPVRGVVDAPLEIGPVVLVWALLMRFARPWAVPGALVAAAVVIALDPAEGSGGSLAPELTLTAPALDLGALVSLALPLFLVTMASQNIPGMGVLASFGYRPPLRPALVSTGAATAIGAPFGAHAINLAAITAALMAGPDAHPDPARRWIASATSGVVYLGFGLLAGAAATLATLAPPQLIEAVAGLALVGALAGALTTAMEDAGRREAAIITFVVSASSVTALSISSPFWGLVAGLAFLGLQRFRPARPAPQDAPRDEARV
ncbi:MAG: benzoate/H(+) symporter BenE family transporter [Solirubrobacteraceae bacterium]